MQYNSQILNNKILGSQQLLQAIGPNINMLNFGIPTQQNIPL